MYYTISAMQSNFEAQKNQKALTYTVVICGVLLLLFFIITWPINKTPTPPPIMDLIEVNLGNEFEGFGDEQPLIKGAGTPVKEQTQQDDRSAATSNDEPAKDIETDDNAEEDAAPVTKIEKNNSKKYEAPTESVTKPKASKPATVSTPAPPKPPKPKALFPGTSARDGNNAEKDNGFENQGENKNNPGDRGVRDGNPNSDGNNRGGKVGTGLRIKGDRKIVNHYIFVGDLPKATINAVIKVSPDGKGTFIRIDPKGSTTTESRYANDIRNKLPSIQFDKADHESTVTITFNFTVQ